MLIFDKQNGTLPIGCIPLKIKKFFDMGKITKFNPILQRNGEKSSHSLHYQIVTNIYESLS
jgi:hypothetical protein